MPFKVYTTIQAELRDARTGRIRRRLKPVPANSLLVAFIKFLKIAMAQAGETVKDITATDRAAIANALNLACNAALADTALGIVIGTGTNAVTMTDYQLKTQVTTNITHNAVTFAVENPSASTWRIAIARGFINNTGTTLNIREVGLYFRDGPGNRYCADRTLYSVDVPNGQTVTLTYRITITL